MTPSAMLSSFSPSSQPQGGAGASQGQSASSGQAIASQAQQQFEGVFQQVMQLRSSLADLSQAFPAASQNLNGSVQACDLIQQGLSSSLGQILEAMGNAAQMPTQTTGMGI